MVSDSMVPATTLQVRSSAIPDTLAVVGKLLYHKLAQTTIRYAHLKPDAVKAATVKAQQLRGDEECGSGVAVCRRLHPDC